MDQILTVSELTTAIKKQLESRFPSISVQGEISNFKEQASGHLYFTLKDATSQISAVLFRGNTRGLTRLPKAGDQVIVKGEINVYPPKGNYQIIIRELQYAGVGELLLKLHELKTKLEAKGWFDKSRKKTLPHMPKTIGVVTSATGAVIQDILHILNRRFSSVHIILSPVKVQGEGAATEIAKAIEQFNKYHLADVLIVGRGEAA
jgi:exodeoxyribonuclease VII large subunit